MIVTRKRHIPASWILLAAVPWATGTFLSYTMGTAFLFSLRRFVDNPVALTFILTLPTYISIFLSPACNFLSDRIWTRWGRRRPFVLVAWVGMGVSLFLMPLMPNLWSLIMLYILFSMSAVVGSPIEPLKQEIVPPHQRGGATGVMQWMQNIAGLVFYFVALGRFDDVRFMSRCLISGETLIYWLAALLLFATFFVLVLGIKEIDPHSPLVGQRLTGRAIFGALLDRELWPVYTLAFASAMMGASLGPLGNLLYTDQWGYTKQDMGTNVAVGGVLNIFLIGFLALIADRLNRLRAYQTLIVLFLLVQVFYFVYVEYVLPDRRPSLVEIILFGETLSVIGTLIGMIYVPLVYDYITRDKMGTFGAGATILGKITSIVTLNAVGFFVWGYATLYGPPAGEMVRICLNDEASAVQLKTVAQSYAWLYPSSHDKAPPSAVAVNAWYPTGIVRDSGTCWEIRLRDRNSEDLSDQIQVLKTRQSALSNKRRSLEDAIQIDQQNHQDDDVTREQKEKQACDDSIETVDHQFAQLQADLTRRTDDFTKQVTAAWQGSLLPEGGQIVSAEMKKAIVVEFAANGPAGPDFDKALLELRRRDPEVIDLRRTQSNGRQAVAVSALWSGVGDESAEARALADAATEILRRREPALFDSAPHVNGHSVQPALVMELRVVENPIDNNPSPVTRVIDALLACFGSAPQPEHRLAATARSLRLMGETEHVGIAPVPGKDEIVSVTTLFLPQAARSSIHDAVTQRLQKLLGAPVPAETIAQARGFYGRLIAAAAAQKITVEEPVLATGYAPLRYDYMTGYIAVFLLAAVGLAIAFAFGQRERRGLIRKLGVEEAEGIEAAEASRSGAPPLHPTEPREEKIVYTPGQVGAKVLVILVGLVILLYGLSELAGPLFLLVDGARATASVVRVIKTKAGLPDQIFVDAARLDAAREQDDRSYTFWNEFQFVTSNGISQTVRLNIGNHLEPLFPLLDDDGLPTSTTICYQPSDPQRICVPAISSTWFAPGLITLMGVLCLIIGVMLLRGARKPIEIP